MIRRLGIAQALLGEPDILLLDEPTVGLDPEEREAFRQILEQIHGNMTILLSTHIIEDVQHTCRHMIVMDHGQILQTKKITDCETDDITSTYFHILQENRG